ncbi:hypothetical protein WDW86_07910 [Bdellovibrionota bacterium FG-2]
MFRRRDFIHFAVLFASLAAQDVGAAGSLGVDSTSYLFAPEIKRESQFKSVQARWDGSFSGSIFEVKGRFEGIAMAPKPSLDFVDVPEAYVGTSSRLSRLQLGVGRRLETWSSLDDSWKLGLWQPRFRWDYLDPPASALVGGNVIIQDGFVRFVALASPVYIPERGVPVTVRDGHITPSLPWGSAPSTQVLLFNQATQVRYNVVMPNIEKVVMNPVYSAKLRLGKEMGPWISGSYGYKPMNQILWGYEAYLDLNAPEPEANVTLHPRVAYHQLLAVETGFSARSFDFSLSLLQEKPDRDLTPGAWTTQEFTDTLSASPTLSFRFGGWAPDPALINVSYLREWGGVISGGQAPDKGPMASGNDSVFEGRYPFQNALKLGAKTNLPGSWGRKFGWDFHLIYDVGHSGTILSHLLSFRAFGGVEFRLGADFLSSFRTDDGTDFISQYRTNDRIHAGISYVF